MNFDLSIQEGFLHDYDLLEKAVLETSRKLNGELSDVTAHILSMYGFDDESGPPLEGTAIPIVIVFSF